MLRIIAMVGDAEASAHLRAATQDVARLQFVHDLRVLPRSIRQDLVDILVLGVEEAELPGVGTAIRHIIARQPGLRLFLVSRLESAHMHAMPHVHLDVVDVILPREDSPAQTRRALLAAKSGEVADMCVRRLICSSAPGWMSDHVHWCLDHDGAVRPNVRALAAVAGVRPETLARRFKALGVCPPNHLIGWGLVLRTKARLDRPPISLAAIADELGIASVGSLANLIRRRTGLTMLEFRRRTLEDLAACAVLEMFGVRLQQVRLSATSN